MDRLSRFTTKLVQYFQRNSTEVRRFGKEISYDLRHIPKKTLRIVYNTITVVTGLGAAITYLGYNSFFKEYYLDQVVLKVDNQVVPIDEYLELLALREWNTAHIARHHKLLNLMNFYVCKGSDFISIGDLQTRTGVDIGIPHYLTYNTIDDIKLKEIIISGKSLDQLTDKSDILKQLLESLVLSEKAKKFAITREFFLSEDYRVVTETINVLFSGLIAVGGGHQLILWLNIRRKFLLTFTIRCISLALGLGFWYIIRQMFNYESNTSADESTVRQGPDYYEGAIEYYEKQLKRNSALYQLLGSEGHKKFTEDGEPKSLLTTVPSIKSRLKLIQELELDFEDNDSDKKKSE